MEKWLGPLERIKEGVSRDPAREYQAALQVGQVVEAIVAQWRAVTASLEELARRGAERLQTLTGLKFSTMAGMVRTDAGWKLSVELVEKDSIPTGMDLLGFYEVYLDEAGNMTGFERRRIRRRGDPEPGEPLA